MRVFLDTNVLVSAVATRGLCADVLRVVLAEHELVVGEVVLDEVRRVLLDRFRVPPATVRNLEALLRSQELVPRPAEPGPIRLRDPDDEWVLATALAAHAEVLVTGDRDLLEIGAPSELRILTPRQLWELLRAPA